MCIVEGWLLCVVQSQLKDAQLNGSEAVRVQGELAGKIKELERKIKNLEGDISQAQDVSREGRRERERFTPPSPLGCVHF